MIKIVTTVMISLYATMAYAQTYTNRDPASGTRDRGTIYVTAGKTTAEKTTTKKVLTLPQSIIDGQYKHVPAVPDAYAMASRYQPTTYDPGWPFSSSVRLENPTPLPSQYPYYMPTQYFGSFAPLTPYGPLVNTALFPTTPTIRWDTPSPRRRTAPHR